MENQFGKVSQLYLTAGVKDGKTILEDISFTAPFKVMHPFYEKKNLEGKDLMTIMPLIASAGIMDGDRQDFRIRVGEGARMEFVSQSYEKIYKMETGHAERTAEITVGSNACLYYTPLPTIPFAGSDYRSTLTVDLADASSRFVYSEVLTCGRIAHGEEFLYHRFQNRIVIRQEGRIIYRDNTCYEPERMPMTGFGMYEGFTHLGSLVLVNVPKSEDWILRARESLDETDRIEGGVTRTAQGHVVVRILGMSGQKLTAKMEELLALEA